jgi:hypothetical protein
MIRTHYNPVDRNSRLLFFFDQFDQTFRHRIDGFQVLGTIRRYFHSIEPYVTRLQNKNVPIAIANKSFQDESLNQSY